MTAALLALRLQVGARTLVSIRRRLVRIASSIDAVVDRALPPLPALDRDADGYHLLSVPASRCADLTAALPLLLLCERQRYSRYFIDLTTDYTAYLKQLSSNARATAKRKARRFTEESDGTVDIRRYDTPEEVMKFHRLAAAISARTYQERLLGSGLPSDAAFVRRMAALAAAGRVRAWLLFLHGDPIAYLYCPVSDGVVRYDYVGHDPAHAALSPGSVLQMAALRDLFDEGGLRLFDFTEGEGQHKRQLATGSVECVDLLLLRPTLSNCATIAAIAGFDRAVATAKRIVTGTALAGIAKRLRRD